MWKTYGWLEMLLVTVIIMCDMMMAGCARKDEAVTMGDVGKTAVRVQDTAPKEETVYGKDGNPICEIKRKYDQDGKLLLERRKIFSSEYLDNAADDEATYPVTETDVYYYKDGKLYSVTGYRGGELRWEKEYDENGKLIRMTENALIETEVVPGIPATY